MKVAGRSCITRLAAALLSWSVPAAATSSALPSPYAARPLALPDGTLRIDAGPKWPFPPYRQGLVTVTHIDNVDTYWHLNGGLTVGIVRDFEVGLLLPLQFAPDIDLHNPVPHLLWRFARGGFEAGLSASAVLPVERKRAGLSGLAVLPGEGEFVTHVGLPLRAHASILRFDFGPFLRIDPGDQVDFMVPFELAIQPTRQFFIGPEVSLVFPDFNGVDIPVGFFAGYTIRTVHGTLGDIGGRMRLFSLDEGVDVWQLMFTFDFFFDL
jgi:hypothetical protein